ncbi:hypothetical protein HK096_003727 [Nowakowskiella sp. JEL0078]|nr:hypothetical protein HK096_003727 [Nowakowskiella sp. JEL0078]
MAQKINIDDPVFQQYLTDPSYNAIQIRSLIEPPSYKQLLEKGPLQSFRGRGTGRGGVHARRHDISDSSNLYQDTRRERTFRREDLKGHDRDNGRDNYDDIERNRRADDQRPSEYTGFEYHSRNDEDKKNWRTDSSESRRPANLRGRSSGYRRDDR